MPPYIHDIPYLETVKAHGIFSRSEIEDKQFKNFARWGYFNPYHIVDGVREYLFFVKPDLHIMDGKSGRLNPELENNSYFVELLERYPYVIEWLQASASYDPCPFIIPFTAACKNNMDLTNIDAVEIDNPINIFGTSYTYRGTGEASDDNITFSIEFKDGRYGEIYQFFRIYEQYERLKNHGMITPPDESFTFNKILHDQIGVYKIITCNDGYSILYMAYAVGVFPKNVPRSMYSNPSPENGYLTVSIDFKCAFIDDSPLIYRNFNDLIMPLYNTTHKNIPVFNTKIGAAGTTWARCPYIYQNTDTIREYYGKKKYELRWRE